MCIFSVIYRVVPECPIFVLTNRDESTERPSASAAGLQPGGERHPLVRRRRRQGGRDLVRNQRARPLGSRHQPDERADPAKPALARPVVPRRARPRDGHGRRRLGAPRAIAAPLCRLQFGDCDRRSRLGHRGGRFHVRHAARSRYPFPLQWPPPRSRRPAHQPRAIACQPNGR